MSEDLLEIPLDRTSGWEARSIHKAFDQTGISFTGPRADTLAAFGKEIDYEGNTPFTTYDGERLPLAEAFTRWAHDSPDGVCDRRTLPRVGTAARPGSASKEDFTTFQEKVAFITANGEEAWNRLPLKAVQTQELRHKGDWLKLTTKERSRRIGNDEHAYNRLPPAPTGQSAGCYINHEFLAKQKTIRPSR